MTWEIRSQESNWRKGPKNIVKLRLVYCRLDACLFGLVIHPSLTNVLVISTMYRLCCGYEWDLFILLLAMWFTLPRPFAGRFHGSNLAWNSALAASPACRAWNGASGGCVLLTGSQHSSLSLFGHGGRLKRVCLTVQIGLSKNCFGINAQAECLGREIRRSCVGRGGLFLFLFAMDRWSVSILVCRGEVVCFYSCLPWSSELHCWGPPPPASK